MLASIALAKRLDPIRRQRFARPMQAPVAAESHTLLPLLWATATIGRFFPAIFDGQS
jgi:hypothetical protein